MTARGGGGVLLLLLVVALPRAALAEEATPDARPAAAPHESPFAAAGWCAVIKAGEAEGPGCDFGVGVSLARYGRLRWVAVVGAETFGSGVAWVPFQRRGGPVIAVAAGVVMSYDATAGIDREVHLALGATLGWGGPR